MSGNETIEWWSEEILKTSSLISVGHHVFCSHALYSVHMYSVHMHSVHMHSVHMHSVHMHSVRIVQNVLFASLVCSSRLRMQDVFPAVVSRRIRLSSGLLRNRHATLLSPSITQLFFNFSSLAAKKRTNSKENVSENFYKHGNWNIIIFGRTDSHDGELLELFPYLTPLTRFHQSGPYTN